MTDRAPRALAVFYGWPSLVNGSNGDVAWASEQFAQFSVVILGDACVSPESDPLGRAVAERIVHRCLVYGYVSLGRGPGQPGLSRSELDRRMESWSRWGVRGVLLDCAGRDFGVSAERVAYAVSAVHHRGLRVVVNAWDPFDVLGSRAELASTDALVAENDVLRHGVWRPHGAFRGRVARTELARRELGVDVWVVATSGATAPHDYGPGLVDALVTAWRSAGADPPALVAFADPLYGASDNRLSLPRGAEGPTVRAEASGGVVATR